MSDYNWREHWQEKPRGIGGKVIDVFRLSQKVGEDELCVVYDNGAYLVRANGRYLESDNDLDLLPVEKPKTLRPWRDLAEMVATTGPLYAVWLGRKGGKRWGRVNEIRPVFDGVGESAIATCGEWICLVGFPCIDYTAWEWTTDPTQQIGNPCGVLE